MAPLCFHLLPGSAPSDVGWALGGAPRGVWLKLCDTQLVAVARNLGARTYLRPCFLPGDDGEGDCQDGAAWAAKVIAAIQAAGGTWPDVCGFRNEMHATAANAAEYQRYRAALRAAGYRGLVVYGSFGVGQPDWPDYATIPADADATELHEYWDISVVGSSPWYALRHQEAVQRGVLPATMPLFIGEAGSDRIPGGDQPSIEDAPRNRRGWQDQGKLSADDQATNLRSYAASCLPSVQAVFVFSDGNEQNHQWDSYRVRGSPLEAVIRETWKAPMTSGIDVSMAQKAITWPLVPASGAQFAWLKATEGVGWTDPYFSANWPNAKAAGLLRGCYVFSRWDLGNDPAAEARYLLQTVGALGTFDNLAFDFEQPPAGGGREVPGADYSGLAIAAFGVLDPALGNPATLYSDTSFIVDHQLSMAKLGRRPLWLADGLDVDQAPPLDWPADCVIYQRITNRTVPGIPLPVDWNETALSLDQLKAMGKPAPGNPTGIEAEALAYYEQDGVQVSRDHAVWTVALLPLYAFWKDLAASGSGMADLVKPGPIVAPEAGYQWGGTRPAAIVRLTNRVIGAYLDTSGAWLPFQKEL